MSRHRTLEFTTTQHGLFPAAATADSENTGYKHVWVRDNVYVAYAHFMMGEYSVAIAALTGLMTYFKKFGFRFTDIINNPEMKEDVMKRPNIRFDGETLSEVEEDWEHAQNDALGYFVWLYCKVASAVAINSLAMLKKEESEMLLTFVAYFEAIRYWEDPDSGHWEEGRKLSASSIGPVVAGLKEVRSLLTSGKIDLSQLNNQDSARLISPLIRNGEAALDEILPWECRTPASERRYDAALLYLIYPLKVVTREQAATLLSDVKESLAGEYGIARYPYDSFWCRDFQDLDKSIQTAKYTGREAWLAEHNRTVKRGEEAQWCIFDPIISAIYGEWFQASGDSEYLALQTLHLNRALGQITGEGNVVLAGKGSNEPVEIPAYRCPELYYIQNDEYVPNVSTPLLWTQANLCIALTLMERSLAARG
ncbi:MAG: glycoside hydrolase family 15 protein [Cyanobacteria bacterium J06650_10]